MILFNGLREIQKGGVEKLKIEVPMGSSPNLQHNTLMKKILFVLTLLLIAGMGFAQKNVLVEELTGTWCQWCPGGMYYGDSLVKAYDNVIFVAIHCDDPMEYVEYYEASGLTGAPTANINRRYFGESINNWFPRTETEMQADPLANVGVANDYDAGTRTLTATVSIEALAALNGGYRIGAIVVEDAVTGPAPAYNQANSYSGGSHGEMGGFENMPNPIPASRIAYDHVGRKLLGGYHGEEGSVPADLQAGGTASAEFTYSVPENFDPDYIRVIGILIAPDASIENAAVSAYLNGSSNAAPKFTSTGNAQAHVGLNYLYNIYFHDTDDETVSISAAVLPDWLNLEQYDSKSAVLQGTPTETGNFDIVLQIGDGENTSEQAFTINVADPLNGSWELVGSRAFSGAEFSVFSLKADNEGNTYVFGNEGGIATVYRNASGSETWEKLGDTQTPVSVTPSSMAVASNGDVFIAFDENSGTGHAMKWDGSSWQTVGDAFSGPETKIFLDHDDTPYLLHRDASGGYMGMAHRLENNIWTPLGDGLYSGYGYWHEMAFDSNNTPYVSYTDYNDGDEVYVSKFENGSWQRVGESLGMAYYYTEIEFDSEDNLYVANNNYTTRNIDLFRLENGAWQCVAENISGCQTEKFDVAANGTDIIIVFVNQNESNKLSVVKFDGEMWEPVGPTTCTDTQINNPVACINGGNIEVAFTDADMENRATCMKYAQANILFPPTGLQAELVQNDWVKLTWNAPAQGTPESYFVYRNDMRIGEAFDLEFTDENLQPGTYHYTVTAKYEDGESTPDGPATVETIQGIGETGNSICVYPTMVTAAVTVVSNRDSVLDIYNCMGHKTMSVSISEGENHIDVSGLADGIYFVSLGNRNLAKIIKL